VGETRAIDLGRARVRAARMSYVGGPGWELVVPVEMGAMSMGRSPRRAPISAWWMPATTRSTPCASKPAAVPGAPNSGPTTRRSSRAHARRQVRQGRAFIGRDALLAQRGQPLRKHCWPSSRRRCQLRLGGETIVVEGEAVGELSSAGFSRAAGTCVALGYVHGAAAQRRHEGTPVEIDLWGERVAARAWNRWTPGAELVS